MKIQRNDPTHSTQNAPTVSNREKGNGSIEVNPGSTPKGDSFVSIDKKNDWVSDTLRTDVSNANKTGDSSDDKHAWDVRQGPGAND